MLIRPNGENWFAIPTAKRDPDNEALYFGRTGEFSPYQDLVRFPRHIARLEKLNRYYAKLNGRRIRAVLNEERLFYFTTGMEEVIYK